MYFSVESFRLSGQINRSVMNGPYRLKRNLRCEVACFCHRPCNGPAPEGVAAQEPIRGAEDLEFYGFLVLRVRSATSVYGDHFLGGLAGLREGGGGLGLGYARIGDLSKSTARR